MKISSALLTSIAISTVAQGMVIPSVDPTQAEAGTSIKAREVDTSNTSKIRLATDGNGIQDKYIVVMKSDVTEERFNTTKNTIKNLIKNFSFDDLFDFNIAEDFKGFTGLLNEESIEALSNHDDVDYIEQDAVVQAFNATTQKNAPWGLARVSSRKSLNNATTGSYLYDDAAGAGVTAYVIDTGINTSHEEFEGRAIWGKTFPTDGDQDGVGHGTHCAGTIGGKTYGIAKRTRLVAVKVLGNEGSGTNSDVIKGMQWAALQHLKDVGDLGYKGAVGSMSLGGSKSNSVNAAANAAVRAGLLLSVAAGNDNSDACNTSPASATKVLTVAASDNKDARASFSNYGSCVDVFAPGVKVLSAWIGNSTATKIASGTSMATPHVSGLLSYFLSLAPSSKSSFFSGSRISLEQMKKAVAAYGTKDAISDVQGTPNVLIYNGAGGNITEFYNLL